MEYREYTIPEIFNCGSAISKKEIGNLFRNLEFARLDDFSIMISYLVDINTTVVICEIDCRFLRNIFLLIHHSSQQVVHLDVQTFFKTILNIESDDACSGVGIESNNRFILIRNGTCLSL